MTVQNFNTPYQTPPTQNYQNTNNFQQNYYQNIPQPQYTYEQLETLKLLRVLRQLLPFNQYVDDATLIRNAAAYIQYLQTVLMQE